MGLFKKKNNTDKSDVKPDASENIGNNVSLEKQNELIAVISAAIAAYENETGVTGRLIFRKIDRAAGAIPAWGAAGIKDQMDTRKI